MKLAFEIEEVTGGYTITGSEVEIEPGEGQLGVSERFGEAVATKITQVPTRIREMLTAKFKAVD